jgi:hypothetical protein
MRRLLLLPLLLAGSLRAQTVVAAGDNSLTLAQLLRFHPEGMILCVPGANGRSFGQDVAVALEEEPAVALLLTSQELEPGLNVTRELARLRGWGSDRPHWALIGADRRIHAEGTEAPTAAALAAAYRESGLRTRADRVRDFLREHADHREALAHLLLELRILGEKRTERLLGPKPEEDPPPPSAKGGEEAPAKGGGEEPASTDPKKPPPPEEGEPAPPPQVLLPDEADARIWEEYAGLYERFITEGHWLDAATEGSSPVPLAAQLSEAADRSPRLRGLAARLLPFVEERLRGRLSDERRWDVWLSLRAASGQGRPGDVLSGMEPLPGARRWPPGAALLAYVEDARRSGDWREAEAVLQATYDQDLDFLRTLRSAAEEDAAGRGGAPVALGSSFGFGGWTGEVSLLVEAKLRLGRNADADRLVAEVFARVPNPSAARMAAALARKCGAPGLADKWERLGK